MTTLSLPALPGKAAMTDRIITSPGGRRLTLREIPVPGLDGRAWEVEEAATSLRCRATLLRRSLQGLVEIYDQVVTEDILLRALGCTVDKAATGLADRVGPGKMLDLRINGMEIYEALEMCGALWKGHQQPVR